MKEMIHDLRFGLIDIEVLSDDRIVELLDYCLPSDVFNLVLSDIHRRRTDRLFILRASDIKIEDSAEIV